MTRKDYMRLATAFQAAFASKDAQSPEKREAYEYGVYNAMHDVARALQADNPRFDYERFTAACIPGANVAARKRSGK